MVRKLASKARAILRSILNPRAWVFLASLMIARSAFAEEKSKFSFIVLPDTQYMISTKPEMWHSLCDWVISNKDKYGIQAVLTVGDIVDKPRPGQFAIASEGFSKFEGAGIPIVPIVGTQEYDDCALRKADGFNAVFGPPRFAERAWYGGNLDGSNANYYARLEVASRRFMVIALEFFPPPKALEWASGIIGSNPDFEVIVPTHGYLNPNGSRTEAADKYGPNTYFRDTASSGLDLWDKLFRKHSNIRAVICGHQPMPPHASHRSDAGDKGNQVLQIFNDFQSENYGDGRLGIMQLDTSSDAVKVSYFRTWAPSGVGFSLSEYPAFVSQWSPTSLRPK